MLGSNQSKMNVISLTTHHTKKAEQFYHKMLIEVESEGGIKSFIGAISFPLNYSLTYKLPKLIQSEDLEEVLNFLSIDKSEIENGLKEPKEVSKDSKQKVLKTVSNFVKDLEPKFQTNEEQLSLDSFVDQQSKEQEQLKKSINSQIELITEFEDGKKKMTSSILTQSKQALTAVGQELNVLKILKDNYLSATGKFKETIKRINLKLELFRRAISESEKRISKKDLKLQEKSDEIKSLNSDLESQKQQNKQQINIIQEKIKNFESVKSKLKKSKKIVKESTLEVSTLKKNLSSIEHNSKILNETNEKLNKELSATKSEFKTEKKKRSESELKEEEMRIRIDTELKDRQKEKERAKLVIGHEQARINQIKILIRLKADEESKRKNLEKEIVLLQEREKKMKTQELKDDQNNNSDILIDDLQSKITELSELLEKEQTDKETAVAQASSKENELKNKITNIKSLKGQHVELNKEILEFKAQVSILEKEKGDLKKKLSEEKPDENLKELMELVISLESEHQNEMNARQEAEKLLGQSHSEIDELKAAFTEMASKDSVEKIDYEEVEKLITDLEKETIRREKSEKLRGEKELKILKLEKELIALNAEMKEQSDNFKEGKLNQNENENEGKLLDRVDQLEKEFSQGKLKKANLLGKQTELNAIFSELSIEKQSNSEELIKLNKSNSSLIIDVESLLNEQEKAIEKKNLLQSQNEKLKSEIELIKTQIESDKNTSIEIERRSDVVSTQFTKLKGISEKSHSSTVAINEKLKEMINHFKQLKATVVKQQANEKELWLKNVEMEKEVDKLVQLQLIVTRSLQEEKRRRDLLKHMSSQKKSEIQQGNQLIKLSKQDTQTPEESTPELTTLQSKYAFFYKQLNYLKLY